MANRARDRRQALARPGEASREVSTQAGPADDEDNISDSTAYSPPRVNARFGGRGRFRSGSPFDLVVDASSGESCNFLKAEDRRRCWMRLRQEDPWVVIGSPPCTAFSHLLELNEERCDPNKRPRKLIEGAALLNFALDA
jgi:hypothetical protein